MIRIGLADDQTLMRRGLRGLLEATSDLRVVLEAGDGVETVAAVRRERPDVLLLDLKMPRLDGVGVLRELDRTGDLPPAIFLTTLEDDDALRAGVRAGARGFLLKDVSFERLSGAIRAVARGETVVSPAVTERTRRGLERIRGTIEANDPLEPLTRRETEVLRLMAGGFSNREIAQTLQNSEGTVKNQVSSILGKMGVRDRTRAVLKALERGHI